MIDDIHVLKEGHYAQWLAKYQNINRITGSSLVSYDDFKSFAHRWDTRDVCGEKITEWNEDMRDVVQEGDQIWMWRTRGYAHVGIYVGDDSMIHVSSSIIRASGVIKKECAEEVIKDSKCFIRKHDPEKLTANSKTPKVYLNDIRINFNQRFSFRNELMLVLTLLYTSFTALLTEIVRCSQIVFVLEFGTMKIPLFREMNIQRLTGFSLFLVIFICKDITHKSRTC